MQSNGGCWAGSERRANRLESSSSSRSYRQEERRQDQVTSISPPSNPIFLPHPIQVSPLFTWIIANTSSSLIFPPPVLSLQSLHHIHLTCLSKARVLWVCPCLAQKHSLAPLHAQLLGWTPKTGMPDLHDQKSLSSLISSCSISFSRTVSSISST